MWKCEECGVAPVGVGAVITFLSPLGGAVEMTANHTVVTSSKSTICGHCKVSATVEDIKANLSHNAEFYKKYNYQEQQGSFWIQ